MACAMMAMEPKTDLTLTDQLQKLNLTELTLIITTFQSFQQLITINRYHFSFNKLLIFETVFELSIGYVDFRKIFFLTLVTCIPM